MSLGWLDIAVVVTYFLAVVGLGLWAGRREKDANEYFLGGRRQHWLIAGISIIATEISAVTYVSVPADSFRGDCNYLQLYVGSFVGRILIVLLLLPAFYGGSVTTVYEYLGQRFGPRTRTTAALMFFVSRLLASGLRLLIGSAALSTVFGWPVHWVIVVSAGVTVLYASFGGIKAILWTDVLQAGLFLGGAVAVVIYIFQVTPGTWTESLSLARDAGKLNVFTFSADLNNDKSFFVLFFHTVMMNMASMGCDQDLTQRMLTCANLKQGQRSLIFNAFAGFPIVCLFLLIGVLLWVFYQFQYASFIPQAVADATDRVFPYFMANELPAGTGMRGLLVSAVLATSMSSLAGAVGALSSSAVNDIYRPLRRRLFGDSDKTSERHIVLVGRVAAAMFGVVLIGVALAFVGQDKLLWEVFKWPSLFMGGLLGVFLLGVTTRTLGRDSLNVFAMISSVVLLGVLKWYQDDTGRVLIAWPWWVVLGTAWTFGVGALATGTGRYRKPS